MKLLYEYAKNMETNKDPNPASKSIHESYKLKRKQKKNNKSELYFPLSNFQLKPGTTTTTTTAPAPE